MSVENKLSLVKERKAAILAGDPGALAKQKEAGKLTARERLSKLLDEGSFVELDVLAGREVMSAVVTGFGRIDGQGVYVFAQDFTVKAGSVGTEHARKVKKVMDLALKTGAPLIAVLDSGGGRLDEGIEAMGAFSTIIVDSARLSGVVPQIALVAGPVVGASAMYASLSDVVLMADVGRIYANGPQITAATLGIPMDDKALGGPELMAKTGAAHQIYKTEAEMYEGARKLISMLPANNLEDAPLSDSGDDAARLLPELDLSGGGDAMEIIRAIADDHDLFIMSQGHVMRVLTALGRVDGRTVGFVATQPSRDEGRLCKNGAAKAARFVRLCDCFNIPVVTLVDSMGLKIVQPDEQKELIVAMGQLTYAYAEATTPKVCVVTGQAIGAAYVALANRCANDAVYAWPGSVVSPVPASAAVQILHHKKLLGEANPEAKRAELEAQYAADVADGLSAARAGYVDDVIEPSTTRAVIAGALEMLSGKRDSRPPKKHGNLPL